MPRSSSNAGKDRKKTGEKAPLTRATAQADVRNVLARQPDFDTYGAIVAFDALVDRAFCEKGLHLRLRTDSDGTRWYKAEYRTADWPCHYIIVSLRPEIPFTAGIAQLCEKVFQVAEKTLRPSKDN